MSSLQKLGWNTSIGDAEHLGPPVFFEEKDYSYYRVEVKDIRLSHAAALFLLQGASLRDLFSDVVIDGGVYLLAFSEMPQLYVPPPTVPRVVLVRVVDRAVSLSPENLLQNLFLKETG